MTRSPLKKILLFVSLTFVVLTVIVIVVILTFDWNRAKPYINERVSETTGRVFEIRGDLGVDWHRAVDESGWRSLVPWPRLTAQDVVLSNPAWAKSGPQMVQIKHITFSINPLPLLTKTVVLPELEASGADLAFERTADGKNNWTFKKSDEPSAWEVEFGRVVLSETALRYLDPASKLDLNAKINSIADGGSKNYGLEFTVGGTYNKAPISGGGKAGGILSLKDKDAIFPIQAKVDIGKNIIGIEGTISQPTVVPAIDFQLSLAGASMANLYPLTGVLLPDTPPYTTKGRLIGKLKEGGGDWTYEKFTGKVGASDLSGTLQYIIQKPRPLLKGSLVSKQLRLEDLGTLVKADSNAEKRNRGAVAVQPNEKALPVEQFTTNKWDAMDADIKFAGRKIIRHAALPIEDVVADLHLKDKILTLTPLDFGVAGGSLKSNIKLDGSAKTIKAEIKTSARGLKIKQLFPTLESMQASLGEVNADASLSGTGNSIAAMLATSNGEIKAAVSEGSVSKFILEAAGLNLPNAIFAKLFGDRQVQLNCLGADFAVDQGVMQTRYFVIDTDDAVVKISGDISLVDERLDLDIQPKTKGLRIISLRSPLYVKGTFKDPDIGLQKGPLIAKAGGAILLGAVAPLAALIPLINPGRTESIDCAKLLADSREMPKAPPPGQKRKDN